VEDMVGGFLRKKNPRCKNFNGEGEKENYSKGGKESIDGG